MPCFVLTMRKNKIERLSDLISTQYDMDTDESPVASAWRQISIQASYDNVDPKTQEMVQIKAGDKDLSPLRFGYVLLPGETKTYNTGQSYAGTTDKYFLCEEMDNAQINVELL